MKFVTLFLKSFIPQERLATSRLYSPRGGSSPSCGERPDTISIESKDSQIPACNTEVKQTQALCHVSGQFANLSLVDGEKRREMDQIIILPALECDRKYSASNHAIPEGFGRRHMENYRGCILPIDVALINNTIKSKKE